MAPFRTRTATSKWPVLKIDVDRGYAPLTLAELTGRLRRAGKRPVWLLQERSASGQGWHLWCAVRPACRSLLEVVALQAVCGSDLRREANNVLRAVQLPRLAPAARRYWTARANVFYDPLF